MLRYSMRGIRIELSPTKLAKWFALPLRGIATYDREEWISTYTTSYPQYLTYLLGSVEGITFETRPGRSALTGEQMILVLLVSECIFPCKNKSSVVGSLECTIAYFMKFRVEFNLSVVMIKHISFYKHTHKKNLPYGIILSWIFTRTNIPMMGKNGKGLARAALNALYMRFYDLYQVDDKEYLTLIYVTGLPLETTQQGLDPSFVFHEGAPWNFDQGNGLILGSYLILLGR